MSRRLSQDEVRDGATVLLRDPLDDSREATQRQGDDRASEERVPEAVEKAGPWALSLLGHLVVVLLAFLLAGVVGVFDEQPIEDEPVVPTLQARPGSSSLFVNDIQRQRQSNILDDLFKPEPIEPSQWQTPGPFDPPSDKPLTDTTDWRKSTDGDDLISDPAGKGTWFKEGEGEDDDIGEGGPPTVVYLIDASGSMVEQFEQVQDELLQAVKHLPEEAKFSVIYFQDGATIEALRPGLKPAGEKTAEQLRDWINSGAVLPRGSSDPMPALRQALAYRPGSVWLLSDNITGTGRYSVEADELLSGVERLKQRLRTPHTRLHTLQFLTPDPMQTLRRLADAHGGSYRMITQRDLR